MFLNAVVLILQEILEAALLISVLLVLAGLFHNAWGREFPMRKSWLFYSLILGSISAWVYAYFTPAISEWFDYVGQELMNSMIHLVSLLFLIILTCVVPSKYLSNRASQRINLTRVSMTIIVMLALVREGSEIILYLEGVTSQSENVPPVILGAIIGSGIGVSCGVFLFYSLISLTEQWALRASLILLALVSGNMASQIVMLLTQADWLPYSRIAWDSGSILAENSIPGHLLYALIGYEATPSLIQVGCYILGITIIVFGPLFRVAWPRSKPLKEGVVSKNA